MISFAKAVVAFALFAATSFAQLAKGPVDYHGRLTVSGNKLVGENSGDAVQVRGMSFYWSCADWDDGKYAKFWTAATVDAMVDGWKSEIVRAAMAADNNGSCGDYQGKKTQTLSMVKAVVDRAIERDIYVIVDWHSHKAHEQQTAAIDFFVNEMAEYHNKPHVIFEIYNEPPDGDANQWTTIKPYMQEVINAIRNANANNLILVGTPYYDQDPNIATGNPVTGNDLAYVLHFYAAQHTLSSRTIGSWRFNDDKRTFNYAATKALEDNKPLFVSEYGTVNADGGGNVNTTESDKWHAFMDEHKISSCNWSINNKPEGASAFTSSFNIPTSGSDASWTNTSNMTASGKYTYEKLVAYAQSAQWRTNPLPNNSSSSNGISSDSGGGSSSSSSSGGSSSSSSSAISGNSSSSSGQGDISPVRSIAIASGQIRIQALNNSIAFENLPSNAKVEVYNLKGKLVHSTVRAKNLSPLQSVHVQVQTKGLYIVKVSYGNSGSEVLKISVR